LTAVQQRYSKRIGTGLLKSARGGSI
jgi:hypothetical protein